MSLDKAEAVPIDTHVWQIAKRDYNFTTGHGQKSITDKLHREIGQYSFTDIVNKILLSLTYLHIFQICFYTGDFFRKLWGPYAGWAHSVRNHLLSIHELLSHF